MPQRGSLRANLELRSGVPLHVRTDRTPWELATVDGVTVGRLARGFTFPAGTGGVSATTLAVACWDKTKSEGEYLDRLKSDHWEVVVPEIVVQMTKP